MKIIYVKWYDTWTSSGWSHPGQIDERMLTCESIGFLYKKDKNQIIICQSSFENGTIGEITGIPRKSIIEYKCLT